MKKQKAQLRLEIKKALKRGNFADAQPCVIGCVSRG
jgi:hypothetical protein